MTPGQTTLTRTPWAAASTRRPTLSPTTACLVVEYGTSRGLGTSPDSEAVLTMWPRALGDHQGVGGRHPVDDAPAG